MDITSPPQTDRLSQILQQLPRADNAVKHLLAALRAGQTVQAQVVAVPRIDVAQLLIDGVNLTARTGRPLVPGDRLTLTVIKDGPAPELQIQTAGRPRGEADVLRVALPRQLPLSETLRSLTQIAGRAAPLLTDAARQTLQGLLDRPITRQSLSAQTIRQAVKESGVFTEATLSRGQKPGPNDQKALLLQLAAALPARSMPSQQTTSTLMSQALLKASEAALVAPVKTALLDRLLQQADLQAATPSASMRAVAAPQNPEQETIDRLWRLVEASLARIQMHQAHSLPREDRVNQSWQLEIPIAAPGGLTEVLDIHIQAETEASEDAENNGGWLVTIGFVFAKLGPVKAGVRLSQGRISTSFWCEHLQTAALFERQLPYLQKALESVGLEVGHLAASQGQAPTTTAPMADTLLDERV